ncbi:MAG: hypothetical protein LBF83_05800 [Spirochaetaceae bacterium]|nr:hypothetical protein [Spirochaetaceae bacterium]
MTGRLPMGQKELLRGKLMAMVEEGKMTLKEAGKRRERRISAFLSGAGISGTDVTGQRV